MQVPGPFEDERATTVDHAIGLLERLIRTATGYLGGGRGLDLDLAAGLAETIDWVAAHAALAVTDLAPGDLLRTIGTIAKTPDDRATVAAYRLWEQTS
jgi:hypothetical protein